MKYKLTGLLILSLLGVTGNLAYAGDPRLDSKFVETPASDSPDPWQFRLALPGWLANTSGTVGLDGVNSRVFLGVETLIRDIDMIATLSAEARKGRFGIYGDMLYVS